VIATHNHAHFLPECLGSVKAQTYPDYEVIVVDNGSTDNTREVVKKLAWDKLRYHYQDDTGSVAGPRNTGTRLALADYVSFLDSDDLWYPEKLTKVMQIINADPSVEVIAHDILHRVHGKAMEVLKAGPSSYDKDLFKQLLFYGNCLAGSATAVKKSVLLENGGIDGNKRFIHSEDYELWLRLAHQKRNFYFLNECLGEIRIHDSNLSHDIGAAFKSQINVVTKHFNNYKSKFPLNNLFLCASTLGRIYFVLGYKYFLKKQFGKGARNIMKSFLYFPFYLHRNKFIAALGFKTLKRALKKYWNN
jgi:glycosyltransferase involved in cell wall biosynthesis